MLMAEKKTHIVYFDLLRVLSMFGVLFMHLSSARLAQIESPGFIAVCALDSFFYIAVPLFFMISGALLLTSPKTDDPAALKTRLPRIAVPLLVWSILTLAIPLAGDLVHGRTPDLGAFLASLPRIFAHEAAIPYWFLYFLIPLYLLSPVLRPAAKGLSEKGWRYLACLVLIVTAYKTAETIFPYPSDLRIEILDRLFLLSGCMAYFFFGYRLHRKNFRISGAALLAFILADTAFITAATVLRSRVSGALDQSYQSYNLLFTALLAAAVFLLVKQNGDRLPDRAKRVIAWLADRSFGVYLAHVPVILLLPSVGVDISTGTGFLISLAVVPAVCLLISWAASRIPVLCYLLTGQKREKRQSGKKP